MNIKKHPFISMIIILMFNIIICGLIIFLFVVMDELFGIFH